MASSAAAQGNPRLDRAMDRYWQADRPEDLEAAIAELIEREVAFDSVYRRLQAGRHYSPDVPTGLLQRRHTTPDGFENHYTVAVPDNYDPGTSYPVRFYLHGGTETTDRRSGENWDAGRFADSSRIAVFPSAWRGSRWWEYSQIQNLTGILRELKLEYNVDENRVYVTGVSDGGIGTYFLGFRHPTPWAALFPFIASPEVLADDDFGADGPVYVPNLRNVPLYIVNGSLDPLFPARAVAADVALFREAGVNVTFQPQPESGHDLRWWPSERRAIQAFIRSHVRDPLPDTITWETERTDRYARAFWVVLDEIGPVPGDHDFRPFDTVQPLPPAPSLGVRADPASETGVRILSVELGSLGAKAGFVEGDVITMVNGTPTPTVGALMEATAGASWGDTLRITAARPGLLRTLLVAFPQNGASTQPSERVVFDRPEPTGRIEATRQGNTVTVLTQDVRRYTLLLSPEQFDLTQPIRVITNGRISHYGIVRPDVATLLKWHSLDQDRTMLFAAELQVEVPAVRQRG